MHLFERLRNRKTDEPLFNGFSLWLTQQPGLGRGKGRAGNEARTLPKAGVQLPATASLSRELLLGVETRLRRGMWVPGGIFHIQDVGRWGPNSQMSSLALSLARPASMKLCPPASFCQPHICAARLQLKFHIYTTFQSFLKTIGCKSSIFTFN